MATSMVPDSDSIFSTVSSHSTSEDMTGNATESSASGDHGEFRFEDEIQRSIIGSVYCLVSVFGFTGNVIVILAVIFSKKLQTRTNAFVVSLAATDLLTCITVPFNAVALFSRSGWPLPDVICSLSGAIYFTSLSCSVISLAAIAINRLVLITKPADTYRSIYKPKNLAAMLVFTWLYPALVCCIPLFGLGRWGYSEKFKICSQDSSYKSSRIFSLVGAVLVYPIPLIILFVCYFKIYRHITSHIRKVTRKSREKGIEMAGTSGSCNDSSSKRFEIKPQTSFKRRQIAITKNLFYVMCAFVACLAPYAISLMIPPSDPVIPWTGMIVIFNSAVNPVIYGVKHPHFNKVFRCMFRCQYRMIPEPSSCLQKMRSR